MLHVLKQGSTARFLSYLLDTQRKITYSNLKRKSTPVNLNGANHDCGKFAFFVHPLNLKNYCEFDESLYDLDEIELASLTDRFSDIARPFVISGVEIVSKFGSRAHGEFIAIPRTAEQLSDLPKEQALTELKYALDMAKDRGARIVGLGAYTSVVSMGGLHLKDEGIALTTGNSYTVISAVDAINMAAKNLEIDLCDATVAVVGASGSIGKGVAVMMSEKVSRLILIGNSKNSKIAKDRLLITVAEIIKHVCSLMRNRAEILPGTLAETISVQRSLPGYGVSFDEYLTFAQKFCQENSHILLSTSIDDDLRKADLVISATSSTNNLLTVDNLGIGAVICDISRPKNIDREVQFKRPDVLALDGGVIKVPGTPYFGWDFGLDEGLAYACMAETMMLALEKHYEHTSIGSSGVTTESVLYLKNLAIKHGFELTGLRSFDEPLDMSRLETVKAARCKL
jgi:predicted amino acid dehydrogenase